MFVSCSTLGGKSQNIVDVLGCDIFRAMRISNLTLKTVCTKIKILTFSTSTGQVLFRQSKFILIKWQ